MKTKLPALFSILILSIFYARAQDSTLVYTETVSPDPKSGDLILNLPVEFICLLMLMVNINLKP